MQHNHSLSALAMQIALAGAGALFLAGCSMDSSNSEGNFTKSQQKAMSDPMNYSVDMSNTDVSGGGTANYDPKAMKHDLDDTLNP